MQSKDWSLLHAAIKADCLMSRADVLEIVVEGLRLHSSATTSLWLTVLEAAGASERKRSRRQKKVLGFKTITDCVFMWFFFLF